MNSLQFEDGSETKIMVILYYYTYLSLFHRSDVLKKVQINITVKTIPHPDPQRLINLWTKIVLKEILRREEEGEVALKGSK